MRLTARVLLALLLVASGMPAAAEVHQPTTGEYLGELARQQYLIDQSVAPVRSARELRSYLGQHPESPIYKMPESVRQKFLAKLVFVPEGVGSFSYQELAGLSVSDAYV